MRAPDVTAKVSVDVVVVARGFEGAEGKEIWVTGLECGVGTSCCDLKLRQ